VNVDVVVIAGVKMVVTRSNVRMQMTVVVLLLGITIGVGVGTSGLRE
jgi:hypothetical protein